MPQPTPEEILNKRIVSRFNKAVTSYHLIEDHDNILVAISGGKDSLCLIELLAHRMKIHRPKFQVEAVHVRMSNISYETDCSYLESFCRNLGVTLHVITTRFETSANSKKPVCFLCSWHRRKQIFNLAQELKCNKIALGHHMDDIIHTAMMNQFFQGQFSTMPVKLAMKKMPITIIRPLCLEHESDIASYAEQQHYEKQNKSCPYEKKSHRTDMKILFNSIEKLNPEARFSMWNALTAANKLIE